MQHRAPLYNAFQTYIGSLAGSHSGVVDGKHFIRNAGFLHVIVKRRISTSVDIEGMRVGKVEKVHAAELVLSTSTRRRRIKAEVLTMDGEGRTSL